jgi:sterol desaturase/sphingolipid hydroxylase (fatty acid hydroxylase superfamily)
MEPKHWITATILATLWFAETYAPFFAQLPTWRERLRHDARNLVWGAVNVALGSLTLSSLFVLLDAWATDTNFGLLRWAAPPAWLSLVGAILILDFWTYWWHRANHAVPFLWRFHRTHHSDRTMDTTTGVRFHTGEILLSWMARGAVIPLVGVSIPQLAIYEAILLPVVLFHHSNLRLPPWLDFGLLALVVTPAMHRVHHSHLREETNSNYGSLLPWWDWLFGSLRLRDDVANITYGVDEFSADEWQTLGGMVRTPLSRED